MDQVLARVEPQRRLCSANRTALDKGMSMGYFHNQVEDLHASLPNAWNHMRRFLAGQWRPWIPATEAGPGFLYFWGLADVFER